MSLTVASRLRGVERTLIRQVFDQAPPGAINLGLGQPDLPSPECVKEAGREAIARDLTGYTTTAGLVELRAAIAARYPGIAAGPDSVVVTIGSEEAVFLAFMALVEPGDEVLVPDPGYPAYPALARILGAVPVPYPLHPERDFALAAADVAAVLTPRTRLLVVNSPGNPTGALDHGDELDEVARLSEAHGFAWLDDGVYENFVYEGPAERLWKRSRRGVIVSALSKELSMTGWRIGWLVAEPEVMRAAVAMHQYAVTCAASVSQHAALAAFTPAGAEARAAIVERFRRRRDRALEILGGVKGLRVGRPRGAFYLFADVSSRGDSMSVCKALLERGVITIPGIAFGARGEGWLRISFAAAEEDLERGLAIVRDYFA